MAGLQGDSSSGPSLRQIRSTAASEVVFLSTSLLPRVQLLPSTDNTARFKPIRKVSYLAGLMVGAWLLFLGGCQQSAVPVLAENLGASNELYKQGQL